MGNDVSRPSRLMSPLLDHSTRTPLSSPSPKCSNGNSSSQISYPLTPPPSASCSRTLPSLVSVSVPVNDTAVHQGQATPPPSGHQTRSSPELAPDPRTPISPTLTRLGPSKVRKASKPTTGRLGPCSGCCRALPRQSVPPRPLKCGHLLCVRCIRRSLVAALETYPFNPARCIKCAHNLPQGTVNAVSTVSTSTSTSPAQHQDISISEATSTSNRNTPTNADAPIIPLAILGPVATQAEFLAYCDKLREMRTPPSERLYCHNKSNPRCSVMFLSGRIGRDYTQHQRRALRMVRACPLCGKRTCVICGGKAHLLNVRCGKLNAKSGRCTLNLDLPSILDEFIERP